MKKFTFSILCLLFSVMLSAQVTNLPTVLNINEELESYYLFGIVPTSLSHDGTNRVYIRTAADQVAIYTNDFTPVKQFNITPTYAGYQLRPASREVSVTITYGEVSKSDSYWNSDPSYIYSYYDEGEGRNIYIYEIPDTWSNMDIAQHILESDGHSILSIETTGDGVVFFLDYDLYRQDGSFDDSNYYLPEKFGKQYPYNGYILRNGYIYWYHQYYSAERNYTYTYGEWIESGEYETRTYVQDRGLGFINYDTDQAMFQEEVGDALCLTQTLFNDDDAYEYLYFTIGSYVLSNYYNEPDRSCWDCESYIEQTNLRYYSVYRGFEVKSENGNTIQSISFPNGFEMESINAQIIKLSNEYYIICTGEMNDNPAILVYKINHNGGSHAVQQIGEPVRIFAYPNLVDFNQQVTIQLNGEAADKNNSVMEVTNMQGQIMERRTIPAGQKQTTLPANRLAPGMNIIRVLQKGQTVGNAKVVVK